MLEAPVSRRFLTIAEELNVSDVLVRGLLKSGTFTEPRSAAGGLWRVKITDVEHDTAEAYWQAAERAAL